jgi:GNAT superfamily N-acetyltransferase
MREATVEELRQLSERSFREMHNHLAAARAAGRAADALTIDLKGLRPVPLRGYHAVMQLRMIRNACREGFAHDNAEISHEQQLAWWQANKARVVGFLYRDLFGFPVGYGLVRRDDEGRWWSSVAVLPQYAGRGFGGAITAHVIRQCPAGVVYAQARKDNPAADRLHNRRDWEVVGEDDRLWHYRTKEGLR